MTLQQLHYVAEVARLGSINKAAQTLYTSQSAVSSAILALEDEFQLKLFYRSSSGVSLSLEGQEFLRYAQSLIDQEKRLEELFKNRKSTDSRQLIVASQHLVFSSRAFIDMINGMHNVPFSLCLKELLVNEVLADVIAGKSDMGVLFLTDVMKRHIDHTLGEQIEFHELCRLHPRICVRSGHPLAGLGRVTQKDLAPYPYLCMYQEPVPAFDHAEDTRLSFGYQPSKIIYAMDRGTIDDILLSTDAYHISCGMDSPRNESCLCLIPIDSNGRKLRLGWITTKTKTLTDEAQQFSERLSAVVTQWLSCARSAHD